MGTQKQFTGIAPVAHLTAAITGTPSTFTVDNASGYPTGAGGVPFVVCLDRGTTFEEKILCSSLSGNVFTVQTRGWDSTTIQNHANAATVEHTIDADTMNDIEGHIYTTTRDDHTQYLRTDGSRANTGAQTFGGNLTANGTLVVAGAVTCDSTLAVTGTITGSSQIVASSQVTGSSFQASLGGSTGRYIGRLTGKPTSGTWVIGDWGNDPTNGVFWQCTASGTPGTWEMTVNGASDSTWTTISTFSGGWGAGSPAPRYKLINGEVVLNGELTAGTGGSAAFTLPSGYQPPATRGFSCDGGPVANTFGGLTITSAGVVTPLSSQIYFLDQVRFSIT